MTRPRQDSFITPPFEGRQPASASATDAYAASPATDAAASQLANPEAHSSSSNHAVCQAYAQSRTLRRRFGTSEATSAQTRNIFAQTWPNPTVCCTRDPTRGQRASCDRPVTDCASRKNAGLELMLRWLGGFAAQVNRQRLGDCAGDRNAPTGNRVFLAALPLLLAR